MKPLKAVWFIGPPLVYAAVIFYFSSKSDPIPGVTVGRFDKLAHFCEYGGFGFLLARAFRFFGLSLKNAALLALVVGALYGASDELHQSFVPNRDSDVWDWVTDLIASGAGGLAYLALRRSNRDA